MVPPLATTAHSGGSSQTVMRSYWTCVRVVTGTTRAYRAISPSRCLWAGLSQEMVRPWYSSTGMRPATGRPAARSE
jgi:hypothetical protein